MKNIVGFRLPADVRPVRHDLSLTPDLETFTFRGEEDIELLVVNPTTKLVLNAAELQVLSAVLLMGDGRSLVPDDIELDADAETVTFLFNREIQAGSATLRINFQGILNDQLRGFYRSQYQDLHGQTKFMATTQFEATDARRAFPCWDEPNIKASYRVTLVVPSNLTAISNMPVESEIDLRDGVKAVSFIESPRMSSYLLAFIVGDLASVEKTAANGTLVRVWATRGRESQGEHALDNAVRLLSYFNDYFGIPYPLPKLDHIAIPDFAAGAMENWGAITYRETALLYDPNNSAANTRQRILEVVSHEMAHMWFGDLVTMEWWNDLWLNESFASWMGDKAVDHLYPEWHMWTQFVSQDTNAGLSLDGLRNSHPIEADVQDPAEIRELFDAISYSKGGATLRMLEEFLGEETFRAGLQSYIARHQYGNAETKDLWAALEEASGLPVTKVMDTWVKQTGYPLLHVDLNREDVEVKVRIVQRRFLYDHLLGEEPDDPTLWQVPVSLMTRSDGSKKSSLIGEREGAMAVTTGSPGDWIKINPGQTGFYRVNYSQTDWESLRAAVSSLELPTTDRLGLQNDAYALTRAGFIDATSFVLLAKEYRNEIDASVWGDLSANLRGLEMLIVGQPYLSSLHSFGRELFSQIVGKVGWDARPGEGHLDSLLRAIVLGQMGNYEDPETLREARARFDRYLDDPSAVHPDLRGVVFGLTAQRGGRDVYDSFWDLEKQADLHEEKIRLLGALTRFQDQALLRETLERSLSGEVRNQDTPLIVVSTAGNRYGRDIAWQFLTDNWKEFDRRYGQGGFAIMRLVSIAGSFTTLERAEEVEEFFQVNPAPSAQRTVQQALERIRLNAKWLELNRDKLGEWFASKP